MMVSLSKLRQMGIVWENVKAFTSLMLNIADMTEDDRLFNFLKGLEPWA